MKNIRCFLSEKTSARGLQRGRLPRQAVEFKDAGGWQEKIGIFGRSNESPGSACISGVYYHYYLSFFSSYLFIYLFFFLIPQTVCPHYGVLTVRERSGVLEVSFRNRGFRLRRLAQSSVCVDSVARNGSRGILGRLTGCPCTF